jgi:deoxyhypusine synthase
MKIQPLSFENVERYSLSERKSKVSRADFGKPLPQGASFAEFLESLPRILAGSDLREVAHALVKARFEKKKILWGMGAHVIKVGLNPIIIDLMEEGFISGILLNGAGIIHDVEIALSGRTSEDVPQAMEERRFGMAEETALFINESARKAYKEEKGLGESVGEMLLKAHPPFLEESLLAQAYRLEIPVTVHVAIGGDIVHMHPEVSGEAIGASSFRDFRILCALVSQVSFGSVLLNIGSAVVLPVVIEKAIAVCRNLGYPVEGFVGVNFDFIRHYRSGLNPVARAKALNGKGYEIIGHHEILIPLLAAAVKEYANESLSSGIKEVQG